MRTTLNTIYSNIQTNLTKITSDMEKVNSEISSGLQMNTIADSPVNLVSALRFRSTVAELDQYTQNIQNGNTVINAAESAMTQMKDLVLRAKTLAIQATDPAYTDENRKATAQEVENLFQEAVYLGNTQVNGKYIFGGFRSTGYTSEEPAPFIVDKGDGYWVNGTNLVPISGALTTGAVGSTADLAAGDLLVNGVDVGAVTLTAGLSNGLNMAGAAALKTAINTSRAAGGAVGGENIDFTINGVQVAYTASAGTATQAAQEAVNKINLVKDQTGVSAVLGTGTNGAPADTIVLTHNQSGNASTITIAGLDAAMSGVTGLRNGVQNPPVLASLTTLTAGAIPPTGATGGDTIDFTINGIQVAYSSAVAVGDQTAAAQEAVDKINLVAAQTGVTAILGDGSNGGPSPSVVLKNTLSGDESAIVVAGLSAAETNVIGLSDNTYTVAMANTGQVSLSSSGAFSISTSATDDSILNLVGLGGGGKGNYDVAGDGKLEYGYPLASGDLKINGIAVPATANDGLSTLYADASAAAKATAINSIQSQTGVTALVEPAHVDAAGAVAGGTETSPLTGVVTNNPIAGSSLAINGTVITSAMAAGAVTNGLNTGKAFNAQAAINQASPVTGVSARLTTLYAGGAAAGGGAQAVSFDLNNVTVSLTTGGGTATGTAGDIASAINELSAQTGVKAAVGTGTNGGAVDSVVLSNVVAGDEHDIVLSNLNAGALALSGFAAGTQSVDATHNTGEISLESDTSFTISSPGAAPPADTFLTELGLSSPGSIGQLTYGSTPKYLGQGDLTINGINIFAATTAIAGKDFNNTLLEAINAKTSQTGVKGTRGEDGSLRLTAVDGRNLRLQTSANGELVTHLTGGRRDMLVSGTVQLRSDRKFILETVEPTVNPDEPGLAALGLAGGAANSNEPGDLAGDGKLDVFSVHDRTGTVRYAGDRVNDLEIKIGKTSTMTVGKNGQDGIMATDIYTSLKSLVNYLQSADFTTVTGIHAATDTNALLNSKNTGLEPESLLPDEDLFSKGSFTVTVSDHDYSPPRDRAISIAVDPTVDSLESVRKRIDGIPNLSATWSSDGKLTIAVRDDKRYTVALSDDSSNFLKATGVSTEFMQSQGIETSLADLDAVSDKLTQQVSDFGARANRIDIQSQIYSNVSIATKDNLSQVQDTDMIQAVMELQAKQTAYQAALSAAAKTMQLSLVDYLK